MRLFTAVAVAYAAFTVLSAQPATAAVLFDNSPTDVNDAGIELVNQAEPKIFQVFGNPTPVIEEQQNILAQITLTSAMTLDGFDTFSRLYGRPTGTNLARPLGTEVTLKIRADVGGRPADTNLFRLQSTITETSAVFPDVVSSSHMRLHADFAETTLAAGTYWIGMSGTNKNLYWLLSSARSEPDQTYSLYGEQVNINLGALGFSNYRVHGFEPVAGPGPGGAVPEPSSWALCITGFGLAGGALRQRRRMAA